MAAIDSLDTISKKIDSIETLLSRIESNTDPSEDVSHVTRKQVDPTLEKVNREQDTVYFLILGTINFRICFIYC